jgi:hypothetical protein
MKQRNDAYFYTLSDRTQDEAKTTCLTQLDTELTLLQNGFKFNQTDEKVETRIAVILRQIRMVESNLCKRAVWNKQPTKNILRNNCRYMNQDYLRNYIRIESKDVTKLPKIESYDDLIHFTNIDTDLYKIVYCDFKELYTAFEEFPQSFIQFE